jgi:hypothetical protein
MNIDQQIEILTALKDGKAIEAKLREDNPRFQWEPWKAGHKLNFAAYDYRIVPEPRRFILFRLNRNVYAVPYGYEVPHDATIVCTAVEELKSEAVNAYLEALKIKLSRP